MLNKKKSIPSTKYYDGRRHRWYAEAFIEPCKPSNEQIKKWKSEWENDASLERPEEALTKLFNEWCPLVENEEFTSIIIKVCAINELYSTNIYEVYEVASIINELNVAARLKDNNLDTNLVKEIDSKIKEKTGRSAYSFITKYCSHHKPELYPIYDSYVDMILRYYRDHSEPSFSKFDDNVLKNYDKFCAVISDFKRYYEFDFGLKEIDMFLWQEGRRCFPQWEEENVEDALK